MQKGGGMSDGLAGLALHHALDALTNRIPRTVHRDDGSTVQIWDDCLLDQLARLGEGGEIGQGGSGKPGSKPPVAIDVLALRLDIRSAIRDAISSVLSVKTERPIGTAAQLRFIVHHVIDADECDRWTELLTTWARRINDLSGAERPRMRALPIACPACGQRWQYVDSDGETVRKPIMSALFDGPIVLALDCASCGSWSRGEELDALVAFMRAA